MSGPHQHRASPVPRQAPRGRLALLALAGPALLPEVQPLVMAGGHLAALAYLWWARAGIEPGDPASATRFYMRVWALFFLEYVLVPAAVVAG